MLSTVSIQTIKGDRANPRLSGWLKELAFGKGRIGIRPWTLTQDVLCVVMKFFPEMAKGMIIFSGHVN